MFVERIRKQVAASAPAQQVDQLILRDRVHPCRQRLPERQRLPLVYMKLQGLSAIETARATGRSESAVKVGVHRGLKALAAIIKDKR